MKEYPTLTEYAVSIAVATIIGLCANASATPAEAPSSAPGSAPMTSTNDGPKIRFATPIYDFGKVDSGQMVKYDYVFTNTGNQLLEIREVRPSCGCTTAAVWDKKVDPGKTGKIPIEFNSGGFGGLVTKTVFIACNDPGQTNLTLQLKGHVWKPIELKPAFAMFTPGPDSLTPETTIIRIVNNLDEAVTLSEPACTNNSFQAELKTVKEGREFELRVSALPPFSATNRWTPIILKTSTERMSVVTVNCYLNVQPAIAMIPSQIMLPTAPLTNAFKQLVTIQNNTTNALILSELTANVEGVELNLQQVQTGRVFTVMATFPTGFQGQHGQAMELRLKSSDLKHPSLRIPVFQLPAPASHDAVEGPASAPASTSGQRALPVASTASQTAGLPLPTPVASRKN